MEQPTHSVEVTRTREDYWAFSKQACKSAPNLRNIRIYYLVAVVVMVILFINGIEAATHYKLLPLWLVKGKYFFLAFCIFCMFVLMSLISRLFMPMAKQEYLNDNQNFLRPKRISIDEKGMREDSDVSEMFFAWQGVDRIEKSKDFILVYVDRLQAFCIPLRNFATPQLADHYYEAMLGYWNKANGRISS